MKIKKDDLIRIKIYYYNLYINEENINSIELSSMRF
jgi:hypothetical protein